MVRQEHGTVDALERVKAGSVFSGVGDPDLNWAEMNRNDVMCYEFTFV